MLRSGSIRQHVCQIMFVSVVPLVSHVASRHWLFSLAPLAPCKKSSPRRCAYQTTCTCDMYMHMHMKVCNMYSSMCMCMFMYSSMCTCARTHPRAKCDRQHRAPQDLPWQDLPWRMLDDSHLLHRTRAHERSRLFILLRCRTPSSRTP